MQQKYGVTRPKRVLNPNFFIPEGLEGFEYEEEEFTDEDNADIDETFDGELDSPIDLADLEVPDTVSVLAQNSRVSANGQMVVDLLIEVEDIADLTQYDIRVTKA